MPDKPTSEQKRTTYKNQWAKENMDRISLALPKGSKETIKAHAQKRGESVNGFIGRAIDETIKRDNAQDDTGAPQDQ